MYAIVAGCNIKYAAIQIANRFSSPAEPQLVNTRPFKDVILKESDIDLTICRLFHHHPG